jgi:hypothetical protein
MVSLHTTTEALMTPTDVKRWATFFERIRDGCGRLNAAYEVGWSPLELRKLEENPDFKELYVVAKERCIEDIEETTTRLAKGGNMAAIQMILYSFGSGRGWRPPQQRVQMESHTTHRVEIVASAKELVMQMLAEGGAQAVERPFVKAIEVEARD